MTVKLLLGFKGLLLRCKLLIFFFGLVLGETLLRNTENLIRTLQNKSFSASTGKIVAKQTKITLVSIRNEESFNLFWMKVKSMASDKEVGEPLLPRKRKMRR